MWTSARRRVTMLLLAIGAAAHLVAATNEEQTSSIMAMSVPSLLPLNAIWSSTVYTHLLDHLLVITLFLLYTGGTTIRTNDMADITVISAGITLLCDVLHFCMRSVRTRIDGRLHGTHSRLLYIDKRCEHGLFERERVAMYILCFSIFMKWERMCSMRSFIFVVSKQTRKKLDESEAEWIYTPYR